MKDVDAAFTKRREANDNGQSRSYVTFSGLLNALDGVAAGEERVVRSALCPHPPPHLRLPSLTPNPK